MYKNRISSTILKENKIVEELELFNLQVSCKATVIKALYYWYNKYTYMYICTCIGIIRKLGQ